MCKTILDNGIRFYICKENRVKKDVDFLNEVNLICWQEGKNISNDFTSLDRLYSQGEVSITNGL